MKTIESKGRLDYLDGVRGIASIMVILHHAMLALHPNYANYQTHYLNDSHTLPFAPMALLWQGNLCVCIFFVLSGYVLAPAMLKTKSGLPALFVRRLVRLGLPTFAALLFGYSLMKLSLYHNVPASEISGSQGWWGELFGPPASLLQAVNDTLVMPFVQTTSKYDMVVWTMHVEYFGSFLIFAIYKILKPRRWRVPLLCVALYLTLDTYYFDFIAGALIADFGLSKLWLTPGPRLRKILSIILFIFFVVFGAGVWSGGPGQDFHWLDWLPETLLGPGAENSHQLAALCLLGALILSPWMQAALSWRPIVKLGHISFGTYLLHLPLLSSLGAFLLILTHMQIGFVPSAILSVTAVIALTLALAVPFTRYIDAQTNRLSHIVGKRIDVWGNRYCTTPVSKLWHLVRHGQAS